MDNRTLENPEGSSGAILGVLLIAAGIVFLAIGFAPVQVGEEGRPLFLVLAGVALIVIAFAQRNLNWMVFPGSLLVVLGLIVAAQQSFDLPGLWAYAWALLFPGAIGVGTAILGLIRHDGRRIVRGVWVAAVGVAMCAFFASFYVGMFGGGGVAFGPLAAIVLPLLLITFGFALLSAAMLRSGRHAG